MPDNGNKQWLLDNAECGIPMVEATCNQALYLGRILEMMCWLTSRSAAAGGNPPPWWDATHDCPEPCTDRYWH